MSEPLPLPPAGSQFFDPLTGYLSVPYQNYFLSLDASFSSSNVPPIDATYWTSRSNSELTNETNIGLLATGYLKIVTVLGVATPSTTPTIPGADVTGLTTASISGLASGTYSPGLTNVANVAASTSFTAQYLRVGTTVTVSGKVDIDPTAGATPTQLGISLPIASNFAAAENCGGTAAAPAVASYSAAILADAVNDRAELSFVTGADVANRSWYYTFTYQII